MSQSETISWNSVNVEILFFVCEINVIFDSAYAYSANK